LSFPEWFIPVFIFAVIDWVVVENIFLWLMYREIKKLREDVRKLLERVIK
jgi:hypothetical protein